MLVAPPQAAWETPVKIPGTARDCLGNRPAAERKRSVRETSPPSRKSDSFLGGAPGHPVGLP